MEELFAKWRKSKRGIVVSVLYRAGGEMEIGKLIEKCREEVGEKDWVRVISNWRRRGLFEVVEEEEKKIVRLHIEKDPDYRRLTGSKQTKSTEAKKTKKVPEVGEDYVLPEVFTVRGIYGVITTNDLKEITDRLSQRYTRETGKSPGDDLEEFRRWLEVHYKELVEKYFDKIVEILKGGEQ